MMQQNPALVRTVRPRRPAARLIRWALEQLDHRHSRTMIQMNIGREVSRRLRIADEQLFRVSMGDAEIDPAVVFPSI